MAYSPVPTSRTRCNGTPTTTTSLVRNEALRGYYLFALARSSSSIRVREWCCVVVNIRRQHACPSVWTAPTIPSLSLSRPHMKKLIVRRRRRLRSRNVEALQPSAEPNRPRGLHLQANLGTGLRPAPDGARRHADVRGGQARDVDRHRPAASANVRRQRCAKPFFGEHPPDWRDDPRCGIKLHAARPLCATLMHSARDSVAVIAAWIGHKDASLTMRLYAHSQDDCSEGCQ